MIDYTKPSKHHRNSPILGCIMRLEIIGTETLGVRSLSCMIEAGGARILIDPGVALGFTRHGLHPHPLQAALGEEVRKRIIKEWSRATDIVISHLHGDHTPLPNPNPFQLGIQSVMNLNPDARVWVKEEKLANGIEKARLRELKKKLGSQVVEAGPGEADGILKFLGPFPHGEGSNTTVLVTLVEAGGKTLAHVPDTQLTCREAVEAVEKNSPDTIVAGGPPLYRWLVEAGSSLSLLGKAWENALRLAGACGTLVIDHHAMRSDEGPAWLEAVRVRAEEKTGCKVLCAAELMEYPLLMLEAWRRTLYKLLPAPNDWFRNPVLLEKLRRACTKILPHLKRELEKKKPTTEKSFETTLENALRKERGGEPWKRGKA